jgi:tRNA nucleotidyltransferase (CCA-adding enzyme)
MDIILTHEQGDFDAIASLMGAYLLDETLVPVLPRRINRNANAFLTLYGMELPFSDPRDLPPESIEAVTLVDTQAMVTLKGMISNPRVKVIDHHPRRENLPKDWQVTIVEVGATTTLLVEALQQRNPLIPPITATLLLLGIYEDTGSLTYTRTTPRDLRAASYLLEQGASLQIAGDFLSHPLSISQQQLYDQLRQRTELHQIHGHTIVVTSGDAQGVDEELSTVAHKLRDLLDPTALFLLINTRGGVQLICRSTSDLIDVAEVASHFGGGGHARAAASLIRDRELKEICDELIEILPKIVRPAITVSQIMSRGPQLLSPKTPVEEAARRMRLYGYEGYPIVENGRVIGLLTRRAVDRAIAHKLNLTAAQLMDAGEITVIPKDSIEILQNKMTDSGWGQIPVVHPDTGEIIGIVTRTDLLKTLTPNHRLPTHQNLASRLEAALPRTRLYLLKTIARAAHEQRIALYIVGGFVRDLLLDLPSLDFDLVVEGDAIKLAKSLARLYGGRITSHSRFVTAKWLLTDIRTELSQALAAEWQPRLPRRADPDSDQGIDGFDLPDSIDLITARTEFYTHPTALPTVEQGSIKLDLHRRDFTINTLALRLDGRHYGELHDYWGGLVDLKNGLVRVLHSLSFVDDPTRMLRAVRFEQRFGFQIEARTKELLLQAISLMDRVSGDRLRHELDHILTDPQVIAILARLNDLNLVKAIHPELAWDTWLEEQLQKAIQAEPDEDWWLDEAAATPRQSIRRDLIYTIWLLNLSVEQAGKVANRLKLPARLKRAILAGCELRQELATFYSAEPSRIVTRLESVPALARYAIYLTSSNPAARDLLEKYTYSWQKISSCTSGNDLQALGLPPGPIYRQILEQLRSAWLNGIINSREQEQVLLENLLREAQEE